MQRVLYSICIGSLALALTAWGQQASNTTTVKAKATKQGAVSAQTTASAKTGARMSGSMAGTRIHQRANVSARTRSSATVDRNRMRNTSANAHIRARNIAMIERVKNQKNVNVRNKTNVHANVNVNDRTRFTNVTRITSNGRTFDRGGVSRSKRSASPLRVSRPNLLYQQLLRSGIDKRMLVLLR